MKLKKLPRKLALTLLTGGASLILGFLSFGGMLAIWPVLPVAFAAFGLSVAYEGEIYLQNIRSAWNKLFKQGALKQQLANAHLLTNFPVDALVLESAPQFFRDYVEGIKALHQFDQGRLNASDRAKKKQAEKRMREMEVWFATCLFGSPTKKSLYVLEIQKWLEDNKKNEVIALFETRRRSFHAVQFFSALSALFMGLGTTYLLVEAFSIIPVFATLSFGLWPLMIVPMAIIAGAAYGLLTYNAVTDMITNDTLRTWFRKIREDFRKDFKTHGVTLRTAFIAVTAVLLVALAVALTICTAGTWWTVAQEARPLFAGMARMPMFIMGVINPIVTGLSSLVFNLQNTSESLGLIAEATRAKKSLKTRVVGAMTEAYAALQKHENILQQWNPFRLVVTIIMMPLRILLFLGHLISIGVTTDRVPGIPQALSALLGVVSEGFEDFHYFAGHDHAHHAHTLDYAHTRALVATRLGTEHGHSHDLDLPTRFLKIAASPLYALAAFWDCLASQWNDASHPKLSLSEAWDKQRGLSKERTIKDQPASFSSAWEVERVVHRIERFNATQSAWVGRLLSEDKKNNLVAFQTSVGAEGVDLQAVLTAEAAKPVYGMHRFFPRGTTKTVAFLEALSLKQGF